MLNINLMSHKSRHSAPKRQQKQLSRLSIPQNTASFQQGRNRPMRSSQQVAPNQEKNPDMNKRAVFQDISVGQVPKHSQTVSYIIHVAFLISNFYKFLFSNILLILSFIFTQTQRFLKFTVAKMQTIIKPLYILFLVGFIILMLPVGQPVRNLLFNIYIRCTTFLDQLTRPLMAIFIDGVHYQ